ncbi:uncharacterized protein LOC143290886 [Babylonia areolata]|uniref:uncharacterized protein LOC143290886 n=1 Tax=Babylonia areolata TaxID=304850 RepID=UPI003FD2160E
MSTQVVDENIDFLFKLVIVGDSGVGKTSLLLRYVDNVYTDTFISTIGVDFKITTFDIDGRKVKLQIWDTAGQDRFRNIVSTFYRGAHAILLVYDVTDMTSLQSVPQWRAEIERYATDKAQHVLVGNKSDLKGKREVTSEDARAVAQRYNMSHVETSAKTSHNLDALFSDVTRTLMVSFDGMNKHTPRPRPPMLPASHAVSSGGICNC